MTAPPPQHPRDSALCPNPPITGRPDLARFRFQWDNNLQRDFTLSLTSSTLPPGSDQLLEEGVHHGVEKLHPRNDSAGARRFLRQFLGPFFFTAAAYVDAARFGHVEIEPPNPDAPPTKAPDWPFTAVGASDWKQQMSITQPRGGDTAGGGGLCKQKTRSPFLARRQNKLETQGLDKTV